MPGHSVDRIERPLRVRQEFRQRQKSEIDRRQPRIQQQPKVRRRNAVHHQTVRLHDRVRNHEVFFRGAEFAGVWWLTVPVSVQPAITTGSSNAEYFMNSLDPNGTLDNRIGVWAMTNQNAVSQGNIPTLSSVVIYFRTLWSATWCNTERRK